MKEVKLTQGQVALVDDEDFENVSKYKWFAIKYPKTYYAGTHKYIKGFNRVSIKMHRLILNLKKGEICDHKDRNGLNNQKSNLRIATFTQNNSNRAASGTSKYLGVWFSKSSKKWQVAIRVKGKSTHLGLFMSELDAAKAYNIAAQKHHGEFANLNQL